MSFDRDAAREIGELKRRLERLETYDLPVADIRCRLYRSAVFSHNSSGNWLSITYANERWDTDGMHDTGSNTERITIVTPGTYLFMANVEWAANATGTRYLRFFLDGTTTIQQVRHNNGVNATLQMEITREYYLSAGQYVSLDAWQDSGGTLNINQQNDFWPEFSAVRIV